MRGSPVFGIAVAGLVLGHVATYALLFPDPHHRGLVLAATGHAYLPALAHLTCILAAASLAAIVARTWVERDAGSAAWSFAGVAAVLALTQSFAFTGQELLERVLSGSPLHDLFAGPLLVVGVGVQLLLALGGAALVTWLRRTTRRLAAVADTSRVGMWRTPAPLRPIVALVATPTSAFGGVHPARSPPSV